MILIWCLAPLIVTSEWPFLADFMFPSFEVKWLFWDVNYYLRSKKDVSNYSR